MNKTIIAVILGILIFGGLVWIARPNLKSGPASPVKSSSTLVATEAGNYNFGTISMAAGKVAHQFKIKNTSSGPIVINKIYTSCMCTTATLTIGDLSAESGQIRQFGPFGMPGHGAIPKIDQVINAGEEAVIEIVFDPAAHGPAGVGRIQRTITLENNAGQPVILQFTATVTP